MKTKLEHALSPGHLLRHYRIVRTLAAGGVSIVYLAHEMELEVTIEGVETEEQLRMVCATGHVDLIQGFIFGKPLPQNSIRDLAAKSVSDTRPTRPRAAATKPAIAGRRG